MSDAKRRARNPVTGQWEIVESMTYREWEAQKKAEAPDAWEVFIKKGKNLSSDKKQYDEYRAILGNNEHQTFAEFQDLKYNNSEKWGQIKQWYRRTKTEKTVLLSAGIDESYQVDARDKFGSMDTSSIVSIQHGFAAFPKKDIIAEYVKNVKPIAGYFDVAMHGSPTAVGIGTHTMNASPHFVAELIRRRDGYSGEAIRLLSCSTGKKNGDGYCFAEELANALGVNVVAPNDTLYIYEKGHMKVGKFNKGEFITYKPNQRRRIKSR